MRVFFCVLFVCVYSFGVRFEADKRAVSHGRPDDWSRAARIFVGSRLLRRRGDLSNRELVRFRIELQFAISAYGRCTFYRVCFSWLLGWAFVYGGVGFG